MQRHHHKPNAHPLRVAASVVLISHSPQATEKLGYWLGQSLPSGSVISLEGDLGAGKTTLIRGLASGIGSQDAVTSPTFTLLIEHDQTSRGLPLYHFDVYRLADETDDDMAAEQFLDAGLDEYFDAGGICVVEWGGLIKTLLPLRTLHIRLSLSTSGVSDERKIELMSSDESDWPDTFDAALNALSRQGLITLCPDSGCPAPDEDHHGRRP